MKYVYTFAILLIAILTQPLFSQTCQNTNTWNWTNHRTVFGGWPSDSLNYSGSTSDVMLDFVISDPADALVNSSESENIPANMPIVTGTFYQSTSVLIIAAESQDLGDLANSIDITINFSQPVYELNFNLFDVDGNNPTEPSGDRNEVITVTGENLGVNVDPTLTGSSANSISGNVATGINPANSSSSNGNVNVSFTEPVTSVTISFQVDHIQPQSANAEPGFGLAYLTFCPTNPDDILPIELMRFASEVINDKIMIYWVVASQNHVSHYIIEYSQNGIDFSPLFTTPAVSYRTSYEQEVNLNGPIFRNAEKPYFLRLRNVDLDGSEGVSHIIQLNLTSKDHWALNKNLFHRGEHIVLTNKTLIQSPQNVQLLNLKGQIIYSTEFLIQANQTIQIPTEDLNGMYLLQTSHLPAKRIIVQ